jgi:tetratricopeptide (TPR) repeat protein
MPVKSAIFGTVGALAAFPRRLAAREVARQGGVLRRGITRRTTQVVFGRTLLTRASAAEIEARYDATIAAGQKPLSEAGFLRKLGLASAPESPAIAVQSLLDQSRLDRRDLALLSLFDAFEHDAEPYSFRDLILAKKYAGLIAGGAGWVAIARSVHRSGEVASLTALSLHAESADTIYARRGDELSELDGQTLLPLDETSDAEIEEVFAAAEAAESAGEFNTAEALYRRCLAADPGDSVAAFNLANCLKALGQPGEAGHAFALAIKRDPQFVEAWFNFADLLREAGKTDAARHHLLKAIAIDGEYADAIYNLAALEYDAGNLSEARRWWARYLERDQTSDWAKTAQRGIQYVDLHSRQSAG